MKETALLRTLLIHTSALGMRLFRNNVGVLQDARGQHVRYGLCVGSADLIGWTPVTITPSMVGHTVAVFTALETKAGLNRATDAQRRFLDAVNAQGGIAALVRELADADAALKAWP